MADDEDSHFAYDPSKNAHLKGRRRFKADLEDMQIMSAAGYTMKGLRLSNIEAGEDDGSFNAAIEDTRGKAILTANFLVSDTSEYPKSHSLFCHSLDPDLSSRLEAIVESVVEQPARPIKEAIDSFFGSVAGAIAPKAPIYVKSDSEGEDSGDESETYDYDDMDDDVGAASSEPKAVLPLLQANFIDAVASSYKPGFTRISGGDDFILSVSIPVISLASSLIPPRALTAWDRRLLSTSNQHLVLLISGFRGIYPIIQSDGMYTEDAQRFSATLSFKVGLSPQYKPGYEQTREAVRKHGLIITDAEDELEKQAELEREQEYWDDEEAEYVEPVVEVVEEEPEDPTRFDKFSLSHSMESLLDQSFLKVVQYRRKFGLGWAGAEVLHSETEKHQRKPEDVLQAMKKANYQVINDADKEESRLGRTLALPHDPLAGLGRNEPINLPLTAFSYLIRRLTLCTKYCIVCHNKLNTDYEALKPYVCDSKLCSYQYFTMNRGPSLEYEIVHNPKTVDLLVSLAYCAASEGALEDPLPIGLGLRVPHPGPLPAGSYIAPRRLNPPFPQGADPSAEALTTNAPEIGPDGLVDFDQLSIPEMRAALSKQIDALPSIEAMKKHLQKKVRAGKSKPKLREMNTSLLPAAWLILRWVVCSCTALIEEITSGNELIEDLDPNWRQFRLSVGAPDAEAKFKTAVQAATSTSSNAKTYPVLYAFHGSPLRNWHSIVRHGLWYRSVANGRAFGDGVYLAKDAMTSMGHYASGTRTAWKNSQSNPTNCVALAEVVNLPEKFVSSNPHFVVADTTWIMCRYLLIKGSSLDPVGESPSSKTLVKSPGLRYVQIDPKQKTTVAQKPIQIPDPDFQLESLLHQRQAEVIEPSYDDEDMAIFNLGPNAVSQSQSKGKGREQQSNGYGDAMDVDDDDADYRLPPAPKPKAPVVVEKPADDWKHDSDYVERALENLMLPPFESSPGASMALQKELRALLREQDAAKSFRELGWYMPPELVGDNLYRWVVEMHSFDPDIPIAKDMKREKINSIIFEIRFPPTYPIAPPFFRIITPRFLPFIHGGGGHVTGGGSICMDLLTSNGWLPSYNIPAVLMQIKLAISNLDPRPARLAKNWQTPYSVSESLAGFKRAASTHGWTVPDGLDRLVR
ncbi:hypothetical protein DFP72DRAFT_812438 [Ephemerocybe angulata]|uniref:UBC core domain-containing protein n=1 Tax=Ephemerocybe angulata TaxID=980116 RepID=A0A8H6HZH7_9AGAR|nr:hypothetical protein DFP72DRAFT_812438 [Tulosesus angulatus]